MRRWWLLSLALFAAAIGLMIVSVASGEGQIGLFLIFPFIMAWGPMAVAGSALLFLAIISVFIGLWRASEAVPQQTGNSEVGGRSERKFGGIVMIGPIPIVFGSDKATAKWMMVGGLALSIALLIIFLILVHPFY